MMKKIAITLLAATLCAGSSMTAFAAPERMPDGGVFDAEYYAENNPDVVAALGSEKDVLYQHYTQYGKNEGRLPGVAFDAEYYAANNPDVVAALGTGKDALYQHYMQYGKNEGRLPSAPGTELTPIETAEQTPVEQSKVEESPIEGILGEIGVAYTLPSWSEFESFGGDEPDKMIDMGVYAKAIDQYEFEYEFNENLAAYTIPGYEWRSIEVNVSGYEPMENTPGRWWGLYYWRCEAERSDNWNGLQTSGYNFTKASQFTVTQDGVAYPECKMFISEGQSGEVSMFIQAYVLLPQNYDGEVLFKIYACKIENGEQVKDRQNAVTYVVK